MNRINFKSLTFALLTFLFSTFFIVSCTEDEVFDHLTEYPEKIHLDDPDVQEYFRVRTLLNEATPPPRYLDSETTGRIILSDTQVINFANQLIGIKENLHGKYPSYQFNTLEIDDFLYKMNDLFPVEIYSRSNTGGDLSDCIDSCKVIMFQGKIDCINNHPFGAQRDSCNTQVEDAYHICADKCFDDIFGSIDTLDRILYDWTNGLPPELFPDYDTTITPPADTTGTPPTDTSGTGGMPGVPGAGTLGGGL